MPRVLGGSYRDLNPEIARQVAAALQGQNPTVCPNPETPDPTQILDLKPTKIQT